MNYLTLITLSLMCFSAAATSLPHRVESVAGQSIELTHNTHLVFFNIWDNYDAKSDALKYVDSLPDTFTEQFPTVWIQPDLNITQAQMKDYQQFFPQVAPLVLDRGFAMMNQMQIWQTPHHVLIEEGRVVFSGSDDELSRSLNLKVASTSASSAAVSEADTLATDYRRPDVGDKAPKFDRQTLSGQSVSLASLLDLQPQAVSLVFLDSMCPMPHYPDCENKIARLNQKVASESDRAWVGVISPFYVDESVANDFAKRMKLDIPLIFDHGNAIFHAYGVHATPYQIEVNPRGRITARGELP